MLNKKKIEKKYIYGEKLVKLKTYKNNSKFLSGPTTKVKP